MPIALDGYRQVAIEANRSGTVTLSGASSPDVVIVYAATRGSGSVVKSVTDSYGLSYTMRFSGTNQSGFSASMGQAHVEEWYAVSPEGTTLSGDVIGVQFSGGCSGIHIIAFGLAGANTTTIWDSNFPTSPIGQAIFSGNSLSTSGLANSFTSNSGSDFAFGFCFFPLNSGVAVSGVTLFNQSSGLSYALLSGTIGGASMVTLLMRDVLQQASSGQVLYTQSLNRGAFVFADAVIASGVVTPVTSNFFQHSGPLRLRFHR